jgi:predicted dienelactone hydrolase
MRFPQPSSTVSLSLLLCSSLLHSASASEPPGSYGAWAVGHRQLASADASRGNRSLPLEVWYPVDAPDAVGPLTLYTLVSSLGLTLASAVAYAGVPVSNAGPRPLIVFSHGSGGLAIQSIKLMEHLASHGFVVVAPSHTGNTQADITGGTAVSLTQALLDRSPDVSFVIDHMTERSADSLDSFFGRIDAQKIGVAGHSLGGFTALAMASGYGAIPPDPRVKAILPIAPSASYLSDAELAGISVPTLLLTGTLDSLLSEQIRVFGLIDRVDRYRVDVIGATHTHFANICDIANTLIAASITEDLWPVIGAAALVAPYHATCLPPAFSIEEATRIQNLYAAAFFRRYLLDDSFYDPYLTSDYALANEPFVIIAVPEPGFGLSLVSGMALLAVLKLRRKNQLPH